MSLERAHFAGQIVIVSPNLTRLKEGLTTLRQQLFEQDQLGADARRIDHVGVILGVQFPQNATALAHAVRPARHLDTTTLYNSTTYNLGAEVFRMLRDRRTRRLCQRHRSLLCRLP